MTDIITRARELLAAATPGPWEAEGWCSYDDGGWAAIGPHHMATEDEGYDDAPGSPAYDRAMADSALIAAAPELLAALCDEVESAERRNMNQIGLIDAWSAKCERVEAERDALRAERLRHMREFDALRAEVERLRARTAEMCNCVHATGILGETLAYIDANCPKCGGAGAVVVEGEA